MKVLKWFQPTKTRASIFGKAEGVRQTLVLESAVLEHVERSRQLHSNSTEAGGQLFGHTNVDEIRVIIATGPYQQDQRGRFNYRSNEKSAQKNIESLAKDGLYYLGEWHTHAEDFPNPSSSDMDAMNKLLKYSKLNVNGLLMLIVGRSSLISGYNITLFNKSGRYNWHLSTSK